MDVDYLATGSVRPVESEGNIVCQAALAQSGSPNCPQSATAPGAFGARIGDFYRFSNFDLGGSFGYLYGGPTAGKSTLTTNSASQAGNVTLKAADNTFRVLIEAKREFNPEGTWRFALGAGIGAALVMESDSCSSSGIVDCGAAPASSSGLWTTWELSPSVLYQAWEFGLRYASFLQPGNSPWNTVGIFAGYHL